MYDPQKVPVFRNFMQKLRKKGKDVWDYEILNWSQQERLTLQASGDAYPEHCIIVVRVNGDHPVPTGVILKEAVRCMGGYISVLAYMQNSTALVTQGNLPLPSPFRDFLSISLPGLSYFVSPKVGNAQVNYRTLRGSIKLDLEGEVRTPNRRGNFYNYPFISSSVKLTRADNANKGFTFEITNLKAPKGSRPVDRDVEGYFSAPGAFLAFDYGGKYNYDHPHPNQKVVKMQYFLCEHSFFPGDGRALNFQDDLKNFVKPAGFDGLVSYLKNNAVLSKIAEDLFGPNKSTSQHAIGVINPPARPLSVPRLIADPNKADFAPVANPLRNSTPEKTIAGLSIPGSGIGHDSGIGRSMAEVSIDEPSTILSAASQSAASTSSIRH